MLSLLLVLAKVTKLLTVADVGLGTFLAVMARRKPRPTPARPQ